MAETIFSSFTDPSHAEKAAGALLDHGVREHDLSVIIHGQGGVPEYQTSEEDVDREQDVEESAKHGISTTTGADAGAGAMTGAGWGLGVGALAALAAIFVPGVGLVLGGGALAGALGTAAATTAAGAAAGAVTGYLKDQGIDAHVAEKYEHTVSSGGAVLAVTVPSGDCTRAEAMQVLQKYGGADVQAFEGNKRGYVA